MTTDPNSASTSETEEETEPQGETPNTTTEPRETQGTTEPSTQTQTSLDELQAQIKRLDAALKKANNDAKSHRLENADLKKFKEQTEAATLSEQQKQELARQNLEKQLAETRAQLTEKERLAQERIVNYEVRLQAAAAGVNPKHLDKVAKLLDRTDFQFDEASGEPTNVKDLLATLVKDMPELLVQERKAPPSSGGATNPPRSQTSKPAEITWDSIGKMSDAEYKAQRAEIQRFMDDPKNYQRSRF